MLKQRLSSTHKIILSLAFPMIASNISTPLLGLVDTAVMGHLQNADFLAAAALGGLIFNFIFWGFGFLRMATTGITAQAYGEDNAEEINATLLRSLLLALVFGLFIVILQKPIQILGLQLLQSEANVETLAARYLQIRICSAPATLSLFVLTGWFLGVQNVRYPLMMVLSSNILNIALDILFVLHLQWGIEGIALATVCAEYSSFAIGLLLMSRQRRHYTAALQKPILWHRKKIIRLFQVNKDIFIRTFSLILCFSLFTAEGAKLGKTILAANSVLMNFVMFLSYAQDGFAHAAEAMTGRAFGQRDKQLMVKVVTITGLWTFLIAIFFASLYFFLGAEIIALLTDLADIRNLATTYLPWLVLIALISFPCFLLDGVFIGATWAREMRNTMLLAAILCYLPSWYFSMPLGNHGLWLALSSFFLARSVLMSLTYAYKTGRGVF